VWIVVLNTPENSFSCTFLISSFCPGAAFLHSSLLGTFSKTQPYHFTLSPKPPDLEHCQSALADISFHSLLSELLQTISIFSSTWMYPRMFFGINSPTALPSSYFSPQCSMAIPAGNFFL